MKQSELLQLTAKLLTAIRYNIEPMEIGQNTELMINLQYISEEFQDLDQAVVEYCSNCDMVIDSQGNLVTQKQWHKSIV